MKIAYEDGPFIELDALRRTDAERAVSTRAA